MKPLLLTVALACFGGISGAQAESKLDWTYDGDSNGQDNWGSISKYQMCETGTRQSPVAISFTNPAQNPLPEFHYKSSPISLAYKDYTLVLNVQGENEIVDNGVTYRLKQIRFHSPSEHTVKQRFYPLEIQMMHQSKNGKQLILAVLADDGEPSNAALTALTGILPTPPKDGSYAAIDRDALTGQLTLDPTAFLPEKKGFYSYTGSLTIPPCTEGIHWRIFKHPVSISEADRNAIITILGRNARLQQPIYMRTVEESGQ